MDAAVSGHTHLISVPPDQPGKVTLPRVGSPGWSISDGTDAYIEMPGAIVRLTGRKTIAGGDKFYWVKDAGEIIEHIRDTGVENVKRVVHGAKTVAEAGAGAVAKGWTKTTEIAEETVTDVVGAVSSWFD